jgi:hypothetical protein
MAWAHRRDAEQNQPMDRTALEESWKRTRAHLGRALEAFDASAGPTDARAMALEYLEHNELELSADALADAADELDAPAFWAALAAAAHEMQLDDRSTAVTHYAIQPPESSVALREAGLRHAA